MQPSHRLQSAILYALVIHARDTFPGYDVVNHDAQMQQKRLHFTFFEVNQRSKQIWNEKNHVNMSRKTDWIFFFLEDIKVEHEKYIPIEK